MFFFFDNNEENTFEEIKHMDDNGQEYWLAKELQDQFDQLTEDQRRLAVRGKLKEHNKNCRVFIY